MAKRKLFLIDGHALCYRCFFAIKALATSKGQPTNAVYGCVRIIRNILQKHRPDYMAVCFDSKEKTRRQEKFAEYKIHRPPMPDDLRSQIPVIKDIIQAFRIPVFEFAGFEADDIIATITLKCMKKDLEVVIVSDDKDMYQLAANHVKFFGSKDADILDAEAIRGKLGFDPKRIIDFIGLAGDASDNIPGVTGIGKVNAAQLINEFGDLEKILKHVTKLERPTVKEKLIVEQQEKARLSKDLAVLDADVPIQYDLEQLKVQPPDSNRLFEIFQELEFRKFAEEFGSQEKKQGVSVRDVESIKDAKGLVATIEGKGEFAFTTDRSEEEGLFEGQSIFVAADDKNVYHVKKDAIKALKMVFENSNIRKVTYDIKDKLKALSKKGITIKGKASDVMLAGYLLGTSQAFFELNNMAWHYLKYSVPEGPKLAGQAQIIERLYPILMKELKEKSLLPLFENIEMPLAFVLYKVEENGVNLDLTLLKKLSKDCAAKVDELTATLYAMAGEEFNLNSPKQLSHILFEKLKLPVIKKTKTGLSTDESVLTILAKDHAFPSLILEYRQLTKLKSTYIDAMPKLIDPKSGRLHAQFNQAGTETGRLSSSQPNLQNIPIRTELGKQIRRAIIPSQKDLVMIAADYSQIELRILAHLSGDKNLINAFQKDEDIHNFTASLIFEVDAKNVTPQMRNSAKRVNFGIIYGMSAFGLANDLNVPQSEAQEFIDRYFMRYPNVKKFMNEEIKKCEKQGYVLTILNRRRYIPEINSQNGAMKQFAQRQAINTPVQGSAADLIKLAMINIQKELDKRGLNAKMISSVHDELVFESPKGEVPEMAELIRYQMEHAVKLDVPVKIIVKVGKNWLDMEEYKQK
ncbi:MAG: DNA polymerase I [Candidatus Omnitrophica bacterium]|nr:DNA polymerase I [Candidatus Omnitrophota bacterium]